MTNITNARTIVPGLILRLRLANRALQITDRFALSVALFRQLLNGPLLLSGLGLQGDLRLLALRVCECVVGVSV